MRKQLLLLAFEFTFFGGIFFFSLQDVTMMLLSRAVLALLLGMFSSKDSVQYWL